MRLLTLRIVWLAGLALASLSCQSLKNNVTGRDGKANPYDLADNGGYTSGSFYGDNTPSTYNADTYAVNSLPPEGAQLASYDASAGFAGDLDDPYVIPFTDHGSPSVAPAARRSSSSSSSTAKKSTTATKPKPATTVAAKKTPPAKPKANVAATKKATPSKKPTTVAAKKATETKKQPASKTVAASGAKKGTAVKTVYYPTAKKSGPVKVRRLHTVKPGDNLTKLASRYGVSVSALKARNKLTSDKIVVGQRLQID